MNTTVRAISGAAMYRWHLQERRYEYVSREIVGLTGFRAEDLELRGRELLMERIHPEDRARVEAEVEAVLGGGRATVFYRFLRKDGTYCTLMEHLYVATEGERRAFLDGVLRDMTDQVSVGPLQGNSLEAGEPISAPGRPSVKGKVAAGVGIAALLVLAVGTGYLTGLRQAARSGAGTAGPANAPGGVRVASCPSRPGTAATPRGKKATKRARLIEARTASPSPRQTVHRVAAAPSVQSGGAALQPAAVVAPSPVGRSVQPDAAASQGTAAVAPPPPEPSAETASPSFWSWVAHLPPQPIAPDSPSSR